MKLVYLANIRIPTEKAHGLATIKMCEAFADKGVSVELVVPKRFNAIQADPFSYYQIKKNFTIKKLFCLDLTRCGRLGFVIETLSFAISATFYCLFHQADIYYGRDDFSLWLVSNFRNNVVWEAHTAKNSWHVRILVAKMKALIAISQGLKDYYLSLNPVPQKIIVAHSGVDLTVFERVNEPKEDLRRKLNLPIDKNIVAYIGKLQTMGKPKGVSDLRKAMEKAALVLPNIFPLIVSNVFPSEVALYMKAADTLVMNYPDEKHFASYMSPLKLFEYMASGTPIITSDLPSVREVLDDSSAFFFKPGDFDGLVKKIIESLEEKSLSEKKAEIAYKKVNQYSWQKRAENILKFINI